MHGEAQPGDVAYWSDIANAWNAAVQIFIFRNLPLILMLLKRRMQPQTPHWVMTPKPSICTGGHFYSMTTLTESIIGLYRTWALGGLITNTNHDPSRLLLIRIMYFWHRHFVLHQEVNGRHLAIYLLLPSNLAIFSRCGFPAAAYSKSWILSRPFNCLHSGQCDGPTKCCQLPDL